MIIIWKIDSESVHKGFDKYFAIACVSIISKVKRDKYITNFTKDHPEIHNIYKIKNNKGKSKFHRKTFNIK